MFRGCITCIGTVLEVGTSSFVVQAAKAAGNIEEGQTVCIDGCRLCVEKLTGDTIEMTLSEETHRRTTFDTVQPGDRVNVEILFRLGDTYDGHLVQGHVDAVGKVLRVDEQGKSRRVWIRPPKRFLDNLIAKGSVAVDGVSLTLTEILQDRFSVALVPSTMKAGSLGEIETGDRVNLEYDMIGKLAARYENQAAAALSAVLGNMPWSGSRE